MAPSNPATIAALRRQIAGFQHGSGIVLPFADPRIDSRLPRGGLPVGQLHEIGGEGIERETGAAAGGFAACLAGALGRLAPGQVLLWASPRCDLYAPGLAQYGIDPARLILAATENDEATLSAMEAALRSGAACVVLGEVGRLDRLAARRLQLACLREGSTALLIRRWPHGVKHTPAEGNAAATRWRVRPVPAEGRPGEGSLREGGQGPPRWQVELLHARGGRPGAWILQRSIGPDLGHPDLGSTNGEENAPHPLRVVAVLGDDAAEARQSPRRSLAAG